MMVPTQVSSRPHDGKKITQQEKDTDISGRATEMCPSIKSVNILLVFTGVLGNPARDWIRSPLEPQYKFLSDEKDAIPGKLVLAWMIYKNS